MTTTFHLAKLYLLSSVRRQIHLSTLFMAVILLMLPAYVNSFSLGLAAFDRVAKDFGLTLIGYFGVVMAIMLGSSSIPKEMETRALYPILARPVSRGVYIGAHFLALAAVLAGSLLFLAGSLSISMAAMTKAFDPLILLGTYACYLQALVVGAISMAFSVRCSSALAGTIGAAGFLIGSLSDAFIRFFLIEDRGSLLSAALAKGLKAAIPNLSLLNIKDPMVHGLAIPPGYMAAISYYSVIWVILLLLGARIAFQKADL